MIRKLSAVVALAVMMLLSAPGAASADQPPYPAPPVVAVAPASAVVVPVLPAVQNATVPTAPLPNTGAGIDIGLWLGIGAVILLVGVGLTTVGTRLVAGKAANH